MLDVRGLRVAYRGSEVVHGVGFDVAEGEVIGMIGANGAGKSSILRAICGLLRPDGGEVSFAGRSLRGLAPERIARLGLTLVPEGRQIFKTLTVAENLRLAAPVNVAEGEGIAAMLERFPLLGERAEQRADRLSGGEQQQLALARALLRKPRLLLLDEPSLGLAPKMIDAAYDLLATLRGEGVTMLLIEQNAKRTIEFCDRCLVLSGGRVRASGTRDQLRRDPRLLHAYLGRQL
jgi:branched-chain amino acid transport system ATP-binding protein